MLSFLKSKFDYNLSLSQCLKYIRPLNVTADKISQVDCMHTLCLARTNPVSTEGFSDK